MSGPVRSQRLLIALGGLLVLLVLAAAPYWGARRELHLLVEFFCYLSLAQVWNLLAGYGGLLSIGQQAYLGLGGYVLYAGCTLAGLSPYAAMPLAAVVAGLIAIPVAWLLFRLRGAYFAVGSWAIAEVFRLASSHLSSLGGGSGKSLPITIVKAVAGSRSTRDAVIYWISLAIAVFIIFGVLRLLRSRVGLALMALRDNETSASVIGINRHRVRLAVYVWSAAATGALGALVFLTRLRISPDAAYDISWTTNLMFIVVIGGIGTIEGPLLGTLIFFLFRELFADYAAAYMVALGVLAISMMLLAPSGVWGLLRRGLGGELFPVRRHLEHEPPSA